MRTVSLLTIAYLLATGGLVGPVFGGVARLPYGDLVTGIVQEVDGDLITVGGKAYDTRNVPIRFTPGMTPVEKKDLRGTRAEFLVKNGKIHSIHIFPVIGE